MHLLGLEGMPRRVYTYQQGLGWGTLNATASIGAGIIALSILTSVINFLVSARSGALAGINPWGADTLEWSVTSPPPPYNFACPPVVSGPNALWDAAPDQPVVVGLRSDVREVLITQVLDAQPSHREEIPGHSLAPFTLAAATTIGLIGSIFFAWIFPIGMGLVGMVMTYWFWPRKVNVIDHLVREQEEIMRGVTV
jgi:cytochrome c oxidase subunit 1